MKMIEVMRNERRDTIFFLWHAPHPLSRDNRQWWYVSKTFFGKNIIALFSKKTIANM
jgi:hypothetical protein